MIFVITKVLGSYGINLTLGDCVRIVDATPTVLYHFLIDLFIYLWGFFAIGDTWWHKCVQSTIKQKNHQSVREIYCVTAALTDL